MFKTQAELLYMQPGNTERIVFKATNNPNIISELIDWFGGSIKFLNEDEKFVTCQVSSNPRAIRFWAMQYSDHVEILEPESLREDLRITIRSAWAKYNDGQDKPIGPVDEIRKLISEWKEISKSGISQEEEKRRSDIEKLGEIVRKTHSVLLPVYGKEPEGQYTELVWCMRNLEDKMYRYDITKNGLKLIIKSFLAKIAESGMYYVDVYPIDYLCVSVPFKLYHRNVHIDIKHFEEDYELLQKHLDIDNERFEDQLRMQRDKRREEMQNKLIGRNENDKKRPRRIDSKNLSIKDVRYKRITESVEFDISYDLENEMIIEDGILKGYYGNQEVVHVPDGVVSIGAISSREDRNKQYLRGDYIGYFAFFDNHDVEEVYLPDSVTEIGFKAFEHCRNLRLLSFSGNLKEIGCNSLLGCIKLKKIIYRGTVFEFCHMPLEGQGLDLDEVICDDGRIVFHKDKYIDVLNFPGTREEWNNYDDLKWLKNRVEKVVCIDD